MLSLLELLLGGLSWRALRTIGGMMGRFVFSVLRVRRRITVGNIRRALGLTRVESVRLASRVYQHLGAGALEFFRIGRLDAEEARRLLRPDGLARLEGLRRESGRGLLVLSAHLGSWDLLACAAARCGVPVNVVTRQIKAGWLDRYWMARRAAAGVRLLPARGSGHRILRALRNNEVVALVLDQHEPGGLSTPFFGRPAATGTSLARLARAARAPVVPAFLLRSAEGGFMFEVGDPLSLTYTDDQQRDIELSTITFTSTIEACVRRNPEQWLWLHRRWKLKSDASSEGVCQAVDLL